MTDELDRDVLDRFVRGDRDAFETLFRRFEPEVHRWILHIVRDPAAADDVVVESFWRVYRSHARFDASQSFGAWMRRIATNAAHDHLRAERRRAARTAGIEATPFADASNADLAESVARAFRRLPPPLQIVASLALIEEKTYMEIANALDIPLGTVKSRLSRAVHALRRELARLGIER